MTMPSTDIKPEIDCAFKLADVIYSNPKLLTILSQTPHEEGRSGVIQLVDGDNKGDFVLSCGSCATKVVVYLGDPKFDQDPTQAYFDYSDPETEIHCNQPDN